MTTTASIAQHHHVTLTPRPDQVEATRALLTQCADQVAAHRGQGPTSWSVSFDAARQVFVVEAHFPSADAVAFHQANILPLVKQFGPMMAAPPDTIITLPFAAAT